jgi:hypothetical protein
MSRQHEQLMLPGFLQRGEEILPKCWKPVPLWSPCPHRCGHFVKATWLACVFCKGALTDVES